MNFDYKNILIMGYGKSGKAVEEILKKINVSYKIYDKNHKLNGGGYYSKLNRKILSQFDLIVVSPGVSIYDKKIVMAEKMGIKVVGELEFGYWFTSSPVIAITGTNGKTTTTSLINSIVSTTYTSGAFGNIGEPLSVAYNQKLDYLVCEVSSFQLESTYSFKPYISILLNIAEDHIDRHKTFDNYIKCKLGLLKNCTEKSIVILNADDKIVMEKTMSIKAKKYYISKFKKVKGVYIVNEQIYINVSGTPQVFMDLKEIDNLNYFIDDVLASILVGIIMKIDKEKIISTIKNFQIAPHRMNLVLEKRGVKYIDDSKSTNVHSVVNALNKLKDNIILLLGGEDKNLNFDEIFVKFGEKINFVIAFGGARKKVYKSAMKCKFKNIKMCKTFYEAVKTAYELAKENNTVLLSPACASFDEFNSYSERGEKFVGILKELTNAKS